MKKINKKQNGNKVLKCCCGKPINFWVIHGGALLIILAIVLGFYFKYGNVAYVNGKGVSRMKYYQRLERADAKQSVDQMILETLIFNEAKSKKIKIEEVIIEEEIKKIEEQIKAQGLALETILSARGMTISELKDQIRLQKILEKLITVTEIAQEQIDEYIKTNKDQFEKTATKIEMQNIAKEELENQAKNTAINTLLEKLRTEAKIIYK